MDSLEEYLRTQLMGPLSHATCGRSLFKRESERPDIYQLMTSCDGDSIRLSWKAKQELIIRLIPVIKELMLDLLDQYRYYGEGMSWDMMVPCPEAREKDMPFYQKHLQERMEIVNSIFTEEQKEEFKQRVKESWKKNL